MTSEPIRDPLTDPLLTPQNCALCRHRLPAEPDSDGHIDRSRPAGPEHRFGGTSGQGLRAPHRPVDGERRRQRATADDPGARKRSSRTRSR